MPIPPLAGAILGTASSFGSNLIQNSGTRRSQDRANKHNVAFWKMQNEYNNPTAQMERLRKAGLNPNLIYGTSPSSAVGNADKIAPSKAPEYKFDSPTSDITRFADVGVKNAQTDNLKDQNTVLRQEAILKAAQTGKTLSEGASAKIKSQVDKALLQTSVDASKENLRQLEQRTIQVKLDNEIKGESKKNLIKDIFYRVENAKENLKGTKLLNTLRQLEADLKSIGIEKNDPWYFRIFGRKLGKEGIDNILDPKTYKN